MANYPIPEEPVYSNQMRMLEITDPAHADLFNSLFGRILENGEYLKSNIGGINDKLGDIDSILDMVNGQVI